VVGAAGTTGIALLFGGLVRGEGGALDPEVAEAAATCVITPANGTDNIYGTDGASRLLQPTADGSSGYVADLSVGLSGGSSAVPHRGGAATHLRPVRLTRCRLRRSRRSRISAPTACSCVASETGRGQPREGGGGAVGADHPVPSG
jgi:hypothetical protein